MDNHGIKSLLFLRLRGHVKGLMRRVCLMDHKKLRVSQHLVIPVAALAILGSALLLEVRSLTTAQQNVELTSHVVGGERELLKLNVDMETGLRGFQYTGRAEFLQPYREADQVVDSKFSALDEHVSNDPPSKRVVEGIRRSFEQWRLLAVSAIARRADNSIHDSDEVRYEQTLERKVLMDKIRAQYASFDASEMLLRNQYRKSVRDEYLLTGAICILIAFGGGISLALSVRRHKRRLILREEQEEQRRSDESLRRMVWGVKDYAILMLDSEGLVVTWNEGAERIKGYRAEEIIGRHFSTFYPAAIAALGKPALELKIAAQKGRFEEEGWRVRKDGSMYWASVVITALRDEDGRLSGFAKVIRDMPKPEDAEQALLTAEALRKAIFNSANFSKIATDANGVIQIFNVGAERMLGYKADDVVNRITPADISDPNELIARAGALSAELETPIAPGFEALVFKASRGIEDIYELTYVRKDGSRFPAIVSVTALRDANDSVIGYLLIGTDNTARKRAEEELLKAGALQRAIFNSANFSSIATDANGVIQIFNVGAERMLGYTASDVMNKLTPADISDSQELTTRAQMLSAELGTPITPGFEALVFKASRGIEDIYELTFIRKDGSRLPAVMSVTALRDAQDGIIGYLLIGTDNSARKQAADALRENADLLRTIHLHSIVSVANRAGRITDVNDTFCAISGYSRKELLGQTHHIINSGVHDRAFWTAMWKSIASGKSWRGEICNRSKEGSLYWVDSIIVPFMDEDGHPSKFLSIRNDITAAKQQEKQLREETENAKVANGAKSDFLANMSHEIRTPLNAIIGMTYLASRSDPSQKQHSYLTKISGAAQSLLSLTNDILDFSKIEAGKLQLENIPFSLDKVLSNLNDIVSHRAEQKGLAIVFSVGRDLPRNLTGDPLRLSQVLINLLNNAIKFTEQGEIVVRVVAGDLVADRVQMRISVRDTGIGMTAEQIANLFQSFNQADPSITRKFGGTGLGLAISKQLCELMQGTITVESELGKGSTFSVTATFGIDTSDLRQSPCLTTSDTQKKSILVVEDDENTLVLLVNMLRVNGFVVRSASSGEQALSALSSARKDGEAFDLVLMDWRLPGIDGIETSRRLKAHLKYEKMPAILMISAYEHEEVMGGLNDPSLDGFLVKPIAESLLVATIAAIFAAKPYDSTPEPLQEPPPNPPSLVGRKVLLVEDNAINRELATELLADLGIEVTVAVNGQDGVDHIAAEPYDLVLMDIQMPVMDGLTATRLIRADHRFSKLPILAMTAHAMRGDCERSLLAGMNEHITKPIDPIRLMSTLVRWMPERIEVRVEPKATLVEAAPGEECIPDRLPPFDIATALIRTNGKPKLLRKILLGFRDQFGTAAADLRDLIAEGKLVDAERLAHSLKGLAATLEAKDLAESASDVELAFRDGRTAGMSFLIEALERKLIPAIAAVNSLEMDLVRSTGRLGS